MATIGTVEVWALIRVEGESDGGRWIKYDELHVGAEYAEVNLNRAVVHCLKFADEVVQVRIVKKKSEPEPERKVVRDNGPCFTEGL